MVQWKGDIDREKSGGKAYRLDNVESFTVPNFFVLTREEIKNLVDDASTPEEVVNTEFPDQITERLDEAYDEIGMSSEVRNASGRARDLVENQRNSQRVSVRVSGERKGVFDFRLNVGSSGLESAIKSVASSHYEVETSHDHPAIIVQKMVEPGYTGAAVNDYLGDRGLMEFMKGLGKPLEDGTSRPAFYLVQNGKVQQRNVPEQQITVSRNKMTGSHERSTAAVEEPFKESEVEQLFQAMERENVNVKFVYSRGTFNIVDAYRSKGSNPNPFDTFQPDLEGIRVSEGEIEGVLGREVSFSEETVPPDRYDTALIARKGGYTSSDAQLAREKERPAVFSYTGELRKGQRISLGARETDISQQEKEMQEGFSPDQDLSGTISQAASEVMPVNSGNGIYTSPPFHQARYAVTDREVRGERIPRSGYLDSYSRVFNFSGEKAVVDYRKMEPEGIQNAIEYLEAEKKVLLMNRPDPEVVRKAVREGFQAFGFEPRYLEEARQVVAREEKRFILEKLRELSE